MAAVRDFDDDNFRDQVLESERPVLVGFTASWCGPCRILEPVLGEVAGMYDGEVVVGSVDADACPRLTTTYDVRRVPALLFFRGGRLEGRLRPVASRHVLATQIEAALAGSELAGA